MAEAELLRLPLRCDRQAPGAARSAVKELDAVDPVRDDAVLLASELVSTAVIEHGPDTCGEETIELVALRVETGVRLAVACDRGPEPQPHGLIARVIERLSRRWELESADDSPCIWAELAL